MADTYFELPSSPEEIGVSLPPSNLRRIDFSALDFSTSRRAILEYIKTYYPNDFNDYVASNGVMMFTEIQASNVAKLALRSDMLANEAFLPTATTEEAVINHLALINQRIHRQTPAVVDIEVSVPIALTTDVRIPAGLQFQVRGPNKSNVFYELYRAPGDFTSDIIIYAGKRGIIGYGVEGRFASPLSLVSAGGDKQSFVVRDNLILEEPFVVYVGEEDYDYMWQVTTDPLELFGPNDEVVNVQFFSDQAILTFGDNVYGKAPLSGQNIIIKYRVGGGINGRIPSLAINETRQISPLPPASSAVSVLFRNTTPSSGGTDAETLEQAKRRAPREFSVRAFASDRPASIVTASDYSQMASTFSHAVYGSISKAVATVRTSINSNLVELYVLANGVDGLVTPSSGLKIALGNYIDNYNTLTDQTVVLDGSIKTVDVELVVIVDKNSDATFIRNSISKNLDNFFDPINRDFGQALYVSNLIKLITDIDGVKYVDLKSPMNNILPTNELASDSNVDGVGINEIIVEGNRDVQVFYSKN